MKQMATNVFRGLVKVKTINASSPASVLQEGEVALNSYFYTANISVAGDFPNVHINYPTSSQIAMYNNTLWIGNKKVCVENAAKSEFSRYSAVALTTRYVTIDHSESTSYTIKASVTDANSDPAFNTHELVFGRIPGGYVISPISARYTDFKDNYGRPYFGDPVSAPPEWIYTGVPSSSDKNRLGAVAVNFSYESQYSFDSQISHILNLDTTSSNSLKFFGTTLPTSAAELLKYKEGDVFFLIRE